MDKGKSIIESDGDGDKGRLPTKPKHLWGPARRGDVGASSSRSGAGGASSSTSAPTGTGTGTHEIVPCDDDSSSSSAPTAPREMEVSEDEQEQYVRLHNRGRGASSSRPGPPLPQEVAPFEGGQYVRLHNSGRGGYLFANETGRGVSVDHRRGMVNTAWAVEIMHTARAAVVLLRGAYGRYLSATGSSARSGLVGCYATQRAFDFSDDHDIEWSIAKGKSGSVVLLHGMEIGQTALRANGRYQRWNTDVTVGPVNLNHLSSMMEWEVQIIPLTAERPPYQPRRPNAAIRWDKGLCNGIKRVEISFTYAWFGDNGRVEWRWMNICFGGRSLTELGKEIAKRLGNGVQVEKMTLCVQAGNYGRPTPLLTDLPLRDDPVIILVFMVDSPGHGRLRFPNLAAE
ncbi:hypothetical protein BS78_01G100500 [Paspalum vaginatum]|nr:hypothetical protein BS78_01G100500 [Paspalum vaginatum]